MLAEYENGTTYFVHSDHLGSTRLLTGLNQSVVQNLDYLPLGELNSSGSGPTSHKFTGQERDSESGLDDFGARYYASSLGRFATPDPIQHPSQSSWDADEFLATPQRWNEYAYVLNNPLNHTDPNGDEIPVWERRLEGGPPTDAKTALSEALLVGEVGATASAGGAGVLARAAAYGRGLITAAIGYFLTPQGQQTATNLAEAIAPPGLNIDLGRTFGFTSIGGQIEGFTYGRFANGAEVAANFSKSGGNVTASILGAFNPEGAKPAGTLNAILKGAQAVAKEQGATSLTIQAVAVTNSKLAALLIKQGFTETTIKVGKETVKAYVKTIKVQ